MRTLLLTLVGVGAGCHAAGPSGTLLALRGACAGGQYWDGHACATRGNAPVRIAAGKQALAKSELDAAKVELDAALTAGPLDHASNVTLWEQRGIAAAYVDDEPAASAAFETLLALDPGHFLSYTLSPKATFVFEKVRDKVKEGSAPAIDVNWANGQIVGDPIPLDVEVLADPRHFLRRATLFVRTRGDAAWRAADVELDAGHPGAHRVVLPAVEATRPLSLELYLRAYDDKNNEVLVWADPTRPREIPLRYDPPAPWYRKWWVIAIAGSAVAMSTGVVVYELTIAPPDKISGKVTNQ